ncbi:hypothetical protein [Guggenheimella bovis]
MMSLWILLVIIVLIPLLIAIIGMIKNIISTNRRMKGPIVKHSGVIFSVQEEGNQREIVLDLEGQRKIYLTRLPKDRFIEGETIHFGARENWIIEIYS